MFVHRPGQFWLTVGPFSRILLDLPVGHIGHWGGGGGGALKHFFARAFILSHITLYISMVVLWGPILYHNDTVTGWGPCDIMIFFMKFIFSSYLHLSGGPNSYFVPIGD